MKNDRGPILHVTAIEITARTLLLPQLQALRDKGYRVTLACAPEGRSFHPSLDVFEPHPIRFPRKFEPGSLMSAMWELKRLIRTCRPRVVHFHTPAASIPGRAALALGSSGWPRVVFTAHGLSYQADSSGRSDRYLAHIERLLSRRTDLLLFQSREDLDHARESGYCGRLRYLGNGVEDGWFTGEDRRVRRRGRLRAVYVGRLTRAKGLLDLLTALREVDSVDLTVVGSELPSDRGGVMAKTHDIAAGLGDRVRFTGSLDAAAIRRLLASADVFVLPSWREGLPRSIIEAMAAGLPVLASGIRGCRELVEPGVNGWSFPPRNPSGLSSTLRQAAETPTLELAQMGRASFDRASTHHREAAVFRRLFAAYDELGVGP
jgi:glycosyltransferase involved in cell wall biosynthesis